MSPHLPTHSPIDTPAHFYNTQIKQIRTPTLGVAGQDTVVGLLARLAVERHGWTDVLRALSRAERAPAGGISAF